MTIVQKHKFSVLTLFPLTSSEAERKPCLEWGKTAGGCPSREIGLKITHLHKKTFFGHSVTSKWQKYLYVFADEGFFQKLQ